MNRPIRIDNKSGYAGVQWHNQQKKWYARLKQDGKTIHLGTFKTKEEAYTFRQDVIWIYRPNSLN